MWNSSEKLPLMEKHIAQFSWFPNTIIKHNELEAALSKDMHLPEKSYTFHSSWNIVNLRNDNRDLRELIKLLQPIQRATDKFQKDSETVGTVTPVYLDLRKK